MSVMIPHHFTTRPSLSVNGLDRKKNQRYSPSKRRRRASISRGSPESIVSRLHSSSSGRSSGWIADSHPEPMESSRLRPVYSHQRSLRKSMCPSGSAVHTNPGSALTRRLRSLSIAVLSWQHSIALGGATGSLGVYCTLVLVWSRLAAPPPPVPAYTKV